MMKDKITIIGPQQVTLSALEEKDAARLQTLANNPHIAHNLRNVFPQPSIVKIMDIQTSLILRKHPGR